MSSKHVIAGVFAVGLLGTVASNVQASAGVSKACVFDKHAPVSVHAAYRGVDHALDSSFYQAMVGAQLFVPANEGLTKEWLTASVQHALESARNTDRNTKPTCGLPRLDDVHVHVVSGGNGYWVQLLGRDSKTSEALLTWARNLVAPRTPATTAAK